MCVSYTLDETIFVSFSNAFILISKILFIEGIVQKKCNFLRVFFIYKNINFCSGNESV